MGCSVSTDPPPKRHQGTNPTHQQRTQLGLPASTPTAPARPSPCRSLRALHPRGRGEGPRPYFCEGGHTSQCKRRPVRGWSPCHRPQPVLRATPCAVLPCCDCDQAAHPELWGRSPGCLGEKRGWTVAAGSVQWTRPLAGTDNSPCLQGLPACRAEEALWRRRRRRGHVPDSCSSIPSRKLLGCL